MISADIPDLYSNGRNLFSLMHVQIHTDVGGCTNANRNELSGLVGCYAMSTGKQCKTFLRHYAVLIQQSTLSHVSSSPISDPTVSHKHTKRQNKLTVLTDVKAADTPNARYA